MPFVSEAQRRYMHAKHPEIAKEWEKHTETGAPLPERTTARKQSKSSAANPNLVKALKSIER